MSKSFLFLFFLLATSLLFAQAYTPVDKGSSIKFTIKNLGINTTGSISGIKGSIHYDVSNPLAASFNVTIDAATVNTGNSLRDEHLNKESYFNYKKYPTLSFVSKNVSINPSTHSLRVTGTLTIKGVSKEITFPFTVEPQGDGLLFKGTFPLNRRDFSVGSSSLILSDDLTVSLTVFAKKE
jgi:polyisoprenoid-binding protein YceI